MISSKLLNITQTPANLDINIVQGELRGQDIPVNKMDITTSAGGLQVTAPPAKINVDTYAARSSLGYGHYTDRDFIKREVEKGESKCAEGTRRTVNEGDAKAKGTKAADIALQHLKAKQHIRTEMVFLPKERAEVSFEKGQLEIDYHMKDVSIDWDTQVKPMKYVPGRVDVSMSQRPRVDIEYVGPPLYVPMSKNPGYNPPKTPMQRLDEKI